jgi:molybdopterin converting factor small subunit
MTRVMEKGERVVANTVKVHIPGELRAQVGSQNEVELQGDSVKEVLGLLADRYPVLGKRLFGADGRLNRFVNIYLTTRTSASSRTSRPRSATATRSPSCRPLREDDDQGRPTRGPAGRARLWPDWQRWWRRRANGGDRGR